MKRTAWYEPNQVPARGGWYERDHRKVSEYINPADRSIWVDLWQPASDPRDILFPGVWYVWENDYGLNDASKQHLPWRGLTEPA